MHTRTRTGREQIGNTIRSGMHKALSKMLLKAAQPVKIEKNPSAATARNKISGRILDMKRMIIVVSAIAAIASIAIITISIPNRFE